MPATPKRPPGRPPKPAGERKRNMLAVRVRDDLKTSHEQAAEANQRSLSEEAEMRLEQSLKAQEWLEQALDLAFGRQQAGLILLLAKVIGDTGSHAGFIKLRTLEGASSWLQNPYAFDEVAKAITRVIEVLRPEGEIDPPTFPNSPDGREFAMIYGALGVGFANGILGAVANLDEGGKLGDWARPVQWRLGAHVMKQLDGFVLPKTKPAKR